MATTSPAPFLNPVQLADRLGVSPSTIRVWVRERRIPCLRANRKVIRFELDAVLRALREGERGASSTDGGAA